MKTIFLDLRSKEEFNSAPLKGAINVPLPDILLSHALGALNFMPRNIRIEYYYPLENLDSLLVSILNQHGFFNLHNRGNVTAQPLIYECESSSTIRSLERKKRKIYRNSLLLTSFISENVIFGGALWV
jgi:hypothetical protein